MSEKQESCNIKSCQTEPLIIKTSFSSAVAQRRKNDDEEKTNTNELGYTALELQIDSFYEQLKVIKDHLKYDHHPITKFTLAFDTELWEEYRPSFCLTPWELKARPAHLTTPDDIREICRTTLDCVLNVIAVLLITLVKFYSLELCGKQAACSPDPRVVSSKDNSGHNEMWKDLLLNIVTSLIVK